VRPNEKNAKNGVAGRLMLESIDSSGKDFISTRKGRRVKCTLDRVIEEPRRTGWQGICVRRVI